MLRLDKYLCGLGKGSRSQLKEQIRQGFVTVNGVTVTRPEWKVEEESDRVAFHGEVCVYRRYAWYMLYKPAGVVSATKDNAFETVISLLKGVTDQGLFPAGRLDRDTEGLLFITNDGALAHELLSPAKHVEKVYYAELKEPLSQEEAALLSKGVDIGDDRPTLPARVEFLTERSIYLTITEGRYHQVKRMLQAVGNQVTYLKRVAMGPVKLDEALKKGEYRELTAGELEALKAMRAEQGPPEQEHRRRETGTQATGAGMRVKGTGVKGTGKRATGTETGTQAAGTVGAEKGGGSNESHVRGR